METCSCCGANITTENYLIKLDNTKLKYQEVCLDCYKQYINKGIEIVQTSREMGTALLKKEAYMAKEQLKLDKYKQQTQAAQAQMAQANSNYNNRDRSGTYYYNSDGAYLGSNRGDAEMEATGNLVKEQAKGVFKTLLATMKQMISISGILMIVFSYPICRSWHKRKMNKYENILKIELAKLDNKNESFIRNKKVDKVPNKALGKLLVASAKSDKSLFSAIFSWSPFYQRMISYVVTLGIIYGLAIWLSNKKLRKDVKAIKESLKNLDFIKKEQVA